jgi:hypothetical protein
MRPPAVLLGADPADSRTLVELMRALDNIKSPLASGLPHTLLFRHQRFSLSDAHLSTLRAAVRQALADGVQKAKRDLQMAQDRYAAQQEADRQHQLVAPLIKFFGGAQDPGPALAAFAATVHTEGSLVQGHLQAGRFVSATHSLIRCESAAMDARRLAHDYVNRIISSGETTVRVLEYTRDASFITLGVLATIATAGSLAGATTTLLGAEVGTVTAASAIAFGAPVAATLGTAGMQVALGDKVDWGKVSVDVVASLILARFGGKLSNGLFRMLGGNVAINRLPRLVFNRIVSSVLTHEGAQAFLTAVDATYRRLRGQSVTWDQFTDELLARLTDPRGIFIAALMGAIQASAEYRYGTPKQFELEDARRSPGGEIDEMRAGAIIEDKSVTGLTKVNPRTGKPAQTPAEWAQKHIYDKTIKRLQEISGGATKTRATKDGTPVFPTLSQVRTARKYHFRIEADTVALRAAVNTELARLRALFPGWKFTASFGHPGVP